MRNLHHIFFFFIVVLVILGLSFSSELRNILFVNPKVDAYGHFIGFFILAWVLSSFLKLPTWPLVISLIAYAALSELGQYYLGFRNGEVKDFIADVIGIFCFFFLKWVWLVYGHTIKAK
ncbi:VanZ family protein [Thalassotalea euphylliae]|uniref:VanZ family protein n=1 Tax=Thalassotalea euphylliae TaxID=1655234 RepID=UPI003634BE38